MLKSLIKKACVFFHLDVTKNLKYDRLTKQILKKHLKRDHNCIDIGCHKGEILKLMLQFAPEGTHYAFEPIPHLYQVLENKFRSKAMVYPYALSDENGTTPFQLVKNAPAYSGIRKRRYDIPNPDIEVIEVEIKKLDDVVSESDRIDFVKIDVEGNEMAVFKGARETLKRNKPIVLFEFGKGAGDYYGTTASDLFLFINHEIGLNIYTLDDFLKKAESLDQKRFEHLFHTINDYYFVAADC